MKPIKLSPAQLRKLVTEAPKKRTVIKRMSLEDIMDLETFSSKLSEFFDNLRNETGNQSSWEEHLVEVDMAVDEVVSAAIDAFEDAKHKFTTGFYKDK